MIKDLRKLLKILTSARESATLEKACFAFPHEELEIKVGHFNPDDLKPGTRINPSDYIKKKVALHHQTWIIWPIDEAIEIIQRQLEKREKRKK